MTTAAPAAADSPRASGAHWPKLLACLAACFLAAFIGSRFTTPQIDTWYAAIRKPAFDPPAWVFGPVWTALYAMMAVAAYLVWRRWPARGVGAALALFAVQLALNTLWSILFFGQRSPLAGLIGIAFLWAAILATTLAFARTSRPAAWLMVPYLLWVTFAAVLNASIWWLNR